MKVESDHFNKKCEPELKKETKEWDEGVWQHARERFPEHSELLGEWERIRLKEDRAKLWPSGWLDAGSQVVTKRPATSTEEDSQEVKKRPKT